MTEVGLSARLLRAEQRIRSAKRIVIMLASGILALSVWQAWTFYRFVHRQTLTLNNKTPHAGVLPVRCSFLATRHDGTVHRLARRYKEWPDCDRWPSLYS